MIKFLPQRVKILIFLLLSAIFVLFSWQHFSSYQGFIVAEVIDGDTIRLDDGRRIRYIGVDTPRKVSALVRKQKRLTAIWF